MLKISNFDVTKFKQYITTIYVKIAFALSLNIKDI